MFKVLLTITVSLIFSLVAHIVHLHDRASRMMLRIVPLTRTMWNSEQTLPVHGQYYQRFDASIPHARRHLTEVGPPRLKSFTSSASGWVG